MRYLLLLFLVVFVLGEATAQKFEITPQYGYQIGSKWNYYGGYVKLKASDQFGITLDATINDDVQAEFIWVQQNTVVDVQDIVLYPKEKDVTDVTVNHYQFGAIHTIGYSDTVPFIGGSAGWSTFNPADSAFSSTTKFSFGISGGVKHFFSDHIGVRLQAQLLVPVDWGGVYIGSGGGGVTAGGSLVQLNFSGGLVIAI